MCQRLYIASRSPIATVRRTKAQPYLEIRKAPKTERVRRIFGPDRKHLYVAGAHVVCGCGFPTATGSDRPDQVDGRDLSSMKALVAHLRPSCRRHSTLELYLCWPQEETEDPVGRRTVSLPDLEEPDFRLRHREILTVGRAP
jgi:hypothetical protein